MDVGEAGPWRLDRHVEIEGVSRRSQSAVYDGRVAIVYDILAVVVDEELRGRRICAAKGRDVRATLLNIGDAPRSKIHAEIYVRIGGRRRRRLTESGNTICRRLAGLEGHIGSQAIALHGIGVCIPGGEASDGLIYKGGIRHR
jgi:hypothetical protein